MPRIALPLLLAGALLGASFNSPGEGLRQTELWHENEGGYRMYRIPGIVVTKAGTILAYAEARRHSGNDWDTIDIVMRRSTDGGNTFSEQEVVAHAPNVPRSTVALERKQANPEDVTYNNPIAIADRNGTVHFLFCREYARVYYMRSNDDGRSFSAPREITSIFGQYRSRFNWRVVATGPGHGIQLANGRLLIPVWMALGTEGNGHHPSINATIFSDDDGRTWGAGDIAVPNTSETPDPNETTAVQLVDGSVMLNVRTQSAEHRRTIVTSRNGSSNWSQPHFQQDLPDPICFASLLRFSTTRTASKNRLLFSNPDNLSRADGKNEISRDRRNLTIHLSYDEGKTWPVKKTVEGGSSGYSDLALLPGGTVLCLYEAGGEFPHERLVLARFKLGWLTDSADNGK